MPTNVRRSTRNSGRRVIFKADGFKLKQTKGQKQTKGKKGNQRVAGVVVAHQLLGNKPNEEEVEPVVDDLEEEYTEEVEEKKDGVGKKKLVWENYTKKDLYFHWVKARNDASDLRKE